VGKSIDILVGGVFGNWTVTGVLSHLRYKERSFTCVCKCGVEGIVKGSSLRSGRSRGCSSCGQLRSSIKKRKQPGQSGFNRLLYTYKNGAKKRNLEFLLNVSSFTKLVQSDCHYCGVSPNQIVFRDDAHSKFIYNGIDRVDNSIGYTPENCITCCIMCNRAKHAHSNEEFFAWLKRIVAKWPSLREP